MKTRQLLYAVVESNTKGIKTDLSHWLFKSYDDAMKMASEMNLNNADAPADFQFTVITLMEGK